MPKLSYTKIIYIFFLLVIAFSLKACKGDKEAVLQKEDQELAAEDAENSPPIEAVLTRKGVPVGEDLESEESELVAATWNLNRFSNRRLTRKKRKPPKLQPAPLGQNAADMNELLSYWLKTHHVDIVAVQEVLDRKPYTSDKSSDPDFPKFSGYKLLPGGKIKDWKHAEEYCPVYYRTGEIKNCKKSNMMALPITMINWVECTTKRNKQFFFGCGHLDYGDASTEIDILALRIKAWKTAGTGSKKEYILGMDANSYHGSDGRLHTKWDGFKSTLGITLYPVKSSTNPVYTKISSKGGKIGPAVHKKNHILDFLAFDVKTSLKYVPGSMTIIPLANSTRGYGKTTDKDEGDKFNKEYFDITDHYPVKAAFKVL